MMGWNLFFDVLEKGEEDEVWRFVGTGELGK